MLRICGFVLNSDGSDRRSSCPDRGQVCPASGHLTIILALLFALAAPAPVRASDYETGYATASRLARDLYYGLALVQRMDFKSNPLLLEDLRMPYLQPGKLAETNRKWDVVYVSSAFIDLANYLGHAKAVDKHERGFFDKAVNGLACDNGGAPPAFYRPTHPMTWSLRTMNEQASHFNQMVGNMIAIDMAHHYLGHYQKYASQLRDAPHPAALYSLITFEEWREAVLAGSRNALACGLAPDGLLVLYEAIAKMPVRPAWAAQFLPSNANVTLARKELKELESAFFLDGISSKRLVWKR